MPSVFTSKIEKSPPHWEEQTPAFPSGLTEKSDEMKSDDLSRVDSASVDLKFSTGTRPLKLPSLSRPPYHVPSLNSAVVRM